MSGKIVSSLAALGIAIAPALLKFADVRDTSAIQTDESAETQCISQDDAPVHDRYQSRAVQSSLPEGTVVQVLSKKKDWRHVAYVERQSAELGWITTAHLTSCEGQRKAPRTTDDGDDKAPASRGSTSRSGARSSGAACATDFESCTADGCEEPGSPHALVNQAKRRTTTADGSPITFEAAVPITMDQLRSLQTYADGLVGQRVTTLTAVDRARIGKIKVGKATFGEGVPVRLSGYLAPHTKGASGTHLGAIESVNCRLADESERDFHIPFLPSLGDDECSGVVVEMIPQGRDRHSSWTIQNLLSLQAEKKLVMFVGPLFYDSEHEVNDDCSNLKNGQPKRMSLWEVHPVIEMYVCDKGRCTASALEGWRKVD